MRVFQEKQVDSMNIEWICIASRSSCMTIHFPNHVFCVEQHVLGGIPVAESVQYSKLQDELLS